MASKWGFEKGHRKSESSCTDQSIKTKLVKAKIDTSQKDTLADYVKKLMKV